MYTDTHAHLTYLKSYQDNLSALFDNLSAMQVSRVMAIMCALDENEAILRWVRHPDQRVQIGMSVGLHPCQDEQTLATVTPERLIENDHEGVWAFGETGLDYHWDDTKKQAQKHSFAAHIEAGRIRKKPIIVHTRDAYHDTLDVLKAERCEHGVIHCFTEDYAFAKTVLDMGLYVSFSGIVSFRKSTALQDVAKKLPLDRLLIETDSPYLAPVPKRGRDNEPSFVPYVAAALATLFDTDPEKIGSITSDNFDQLLTQRL